MKVAYFCEPQVGGTFTFFLRLRDGLRGSGISVRCIPPVSGEHFVGTRFAAVEGVDYLRFSSDPRAATRVLIEHLVREQVDAVIVLPGCDLLTTNLVRYLPAQIRAIARVPMMTHGAYRPVAATAAHLDRVVGVCRRIRDDLLAEYDLPPGQVAVIENGADVERFAAPPRDAASTGPLRLLFVGRLEDVQKNVLLLPEIARTLQARDVATTFTIAGDGPDAARLRAAFASRAGGVAIQFLGTVTSEQLPGLYARHDAFVFPTRFEGTPNALLEAMAAGCVPVATSIEGSLDVVVQHGVSGWLCRMGDAQDFAARIGDLAVDRGQLAAFSRAAQTKVRAEFSQARMIGRYVDLLGEVLSSPPRCAAPMDLDRYEVPRALRSNWRQHIPPGVKKIVRTVLGRLGRSL